MKMDLRESIETKSKDIEKKSQEAMDILTVEDIDSVEFWVGNAYQAAYYYYNALGFKPVAWSSLKTGNKNFLSYALQQGDARIILSTPYNPVSEMASHHAMHGDGVKVIGFNVRDVETAYSEAIKRGARGIMEPTEFNDDYGSVKIATIGAFGDTIHKFIERDGYNGPYLPGYKELTPIVERPGIGIERIDHIAIIVNWFQMEPMVKFYQDVFGFDKCMEFSEKDIAAKYSTQRAQVVRSYTRKILIPILEPFHSLKSSQVEEYLTYYQGAGTQHIAFHTSDILSTVEAMKQRGVEFLYVPKTYYDSIGSRLGHIEEDLDQISRLGILSDRDKHGYLLQHFTKPVQDRPTMFLEVIQRHGSQGFGMHNVQTLFEALEREQSERGNL